MLMKATNDAGDCRLEGMIKIFMESTMGVCDVGNGNGVCSGAEMVFLLCCFSVCFHRVLSVLYCLVRLRRACRCLSS